VFDENILKFDDAEVITRKEIVRRRNIIRKVMISLKIISMMIEMGMIFISIYKRKFISILQNHDFSH
jgi:hypothetical protein